MIADISEKSKKNEILDAYYELLNKVGESKTVSHQEAKQRKDDEEIVVKAASFDVEHIISHLAQVRLEIIQNLGLLEKKLTEEYGRLSGLQGAIRVETSHLEEVHQIKKKC
jgi:hypothetical protein